MDYRFKQSAFKDFKKLQVSVQKRILKKLDFYISVQDPLNFAEPLIDRRFGDYRFRIGDWRVFFDFEKEIITILAIGHRKDIYNKKK